jgi:hypothetical protein
VVLSREDSDYNIQDFPVPMPAGTDMSTVTEQTKGDVSLTELLPRLKFKLTLPKQFLVRFFHNVQIADSSLYPKDVVSLLPCTSSADP